MDNNNKKTIYTSLSLIGLALLVVGATYAYFQDQAGEGKQTDITVKSTTTDLLTFEVGNDLAFELNPINFAKGAGNVSGETFAQANLLANNKTNVASNKYNVYLLINSNQFKYSLADKRAEMLLQVIDPTGNQITSVDGLTYTTVTDAEGNSQSGFDITVYKGLLQLASDYEISSTSSAEIVSQKWTVKLLFINYDADQTGNTNKGIYGKLIIQQETMDAPALADVCTSGQSFSDCIINKSEIETDIYHHDGTILDSDGNVIDAADGSYRYSGSKTTVNNYVCFGSDEVDCPDDNIYRIIGVFGDNNHGVEGQQLVKLVKKTTIGSMSWNAGTKSNNWITASLNSTLNSTFITENLSGFENKIAEVSWKISGYNNEGVVPKTLFDAEITNATKKYTSKIGLMYASDYGYSASKSYWTTKLNSYSKAVSDNWIHYSISTTWTITIDSSSTTSIWLISGNGGFSSMSNDSSTFSYTIHPSFYLSSSVNYVSGDGSQRNPYRIN